jgi:hypothetical protein
MPLTEYMTQVMNGSIFTAIDKLLTDRIGGLWYLILFGVPYIMVWIKTENLTLSTVLLLWTISFYGSFINPDGIGGNIVSLCLGAGFAIILFRALSPVR